jgi:serine/threonine protein phosphatase PrpC
VEVNEASYTVASQNPKLHGMGTTIVVALQSDSELYIAHVGDSRAYLIRDDMIRQLTEDHSYVAELVRAGSITPEEARRHHLRNVITRCVGTKPQVEVDIQEVRLVSGDHIVLCTDGLTEFVSDGIIKDLVLDAGEPAKACKQLVDLANQLGGTDNITVIVAHFDM